MKNTLKQIKPKRKAVYNDVQEYIGKEDDIGQGEGGVPIGEGVGHGESTGIKEAPEAQSTVEFDEDGNEVIEIQEPPEQTEEEKPTGVMGDLPQEIQNYVDGQLSKKGYPATPKPKQTPKPATPKPFKPEPPEITPEESKTMDEVMQDIMQNFDLSDLNSSNINEKAESMAEAIVDHLNKNGGTTTQGGQGNQSERNKPQDGTPESGEQNSDSSKSPENEQGEEEKPKGEQSCTEAERAFLDAFMALQEAGSLLGLVPSTRIVKGSHTHNTRLLPVINEVRLSDQMYLQEFREEKEIYELMSGQGKILFDSVEKMLKEKGL